MARPRTAPMLRIEVQLWLDHALNDQQLSACFATVVESILAKSAGGQLDPDTLHSLLQAAECLERADQ